MRGRGTLERKRFSSGPGVTIIEFYSISFDQPAETSRETFNFEMIPFVNCRREWFRVINNDGEEDKHRKMGSSAVSQTWKAFDGEPSSRIERALSAWTVAEPPVVGSHHKYTRVRSERVAGSS